MQETIATSQTSVEALKTARLPQIDYWRGLCLLLIYIHHLPLSFGPEFTLNSFGFCDAVVVFVFLSGFVCRLAFGSALRKSGWWSMSMKVLNRAGVLFVAHLAMVAFAVIAIVLYQQAWPGEIMLDFDARSEAAILASPWREIGLAAIFQQHAWLCHVLPIYFIFIVMVPAFFALSRVSPWLLLILSGALWASVRLSVTLSIGGVLHKTGFWLNPFAWQFVFVAGFVISDWSKKDQLGKLRAPFYYSGVALLLLIAAVKLELFPHADWFLPILSTKPMADFSYIAYFALLALVLSPLVSSADRLNKWPAVSIISALGRRSLAVWVGTACVVYSLFFLRRLMDAGVWLEDSVILLVAFLVLWLSIRGQIKTPMKLPKRPTHVSSETESGLSLP